LCGDTGERPGATAAEHLNQHPLGHVVLVVGGSHRVRTARPAKLEEGLISVFPPGPLATRGHHPFEGDSSKVKGDVQLVTDLFAERGILVGLLATGAMVNVDCFQLEFEL
jgi:hypothetical protein